MKKWVAGMVLMSLLILSAFPAEAREPSDQREFRAFWVDAFHDGIKTPEQVDKLIADAQRANVNALIVQVRRRGDAYFNRALEPRTEDPALQPGFDALQYLIDKAHSGSPRIEVHAWLATLPIWNSATPPSPPAMCLTGMVRRRRKGLLADDPGGWCGTERERLCVGPRPSGCGGIHGGAISQRGSGV